MDSERYQDDKKSEREGREIDSYREVARAGAQTDDIQKIGSKEDIEAFENYVNGNGYDELPKWVENLRGERLSSKQYEALVDKLNLLGIDEHIDSDNGLGYKTIDDFIDMAQSLHASRDLVIKALEEGYVAKKRDVALSKSVRDISGKLEDKLYDFLKRADLGEYRASERVEGDGFSVNYEVSVGESKDNMSIRVGYIKGEGKNKEEDNLFILNVGKREIEKMPKLTKDLRIDGWEPGWAIAAGVFYPVSLFLSVLTLDDGDDGELLHDLTVFPFYKVPRHLVRKTMHGVKYMFRGNEVKIKDRFNSEGDLSIARYIANLAASCDSNDNREGVSERVKMIKFAFENMDSALHKDLNEASDFLSGWKI